LDVLPIDVVFPGSGISDTSPASEAFVTSASAFVLPVVAVDGQAIGSGAVGPIAARFREFYIRECLKPAQ